MIRLRLEEESRPLELFASFRGVIKERIHSSGNLGFDRRRLCTQCDGSGDFFFGVFLLRSGCLRLEEESLPLGLFTFFRCDIENDRNRWSY